MSFTVVAKQSDLAEGQMQMVKAGDQEILLARAGKDVYATQNRCPHLNGNLSHGTLAGNVVSCPRHHSQFDLKDGRVLRWTNWPPAILMLAKIFRPPHPLKTYPVKLESGNILVDI